MPWSSDHIAWLKKLPKNLKTSDGKPVEVWEFDHQKDEEILSKWAKHFRNHYCWDTQIEELSSGYGKSKKDYLRDIKLPDDISPGLGPATRAGDFAEIMVADYLQYKLNFEVPRVRYINKVIKNESSKGCDTIGFKIIGDGSTPDEDILAIYETKAQFSGTKAKAKLDEAITGSIKDELRMAESLNYIRQQLEYQQKKDESLRVKRFQNPVDHPYKQIYGAAAFFCCHVFDQDEISKTKSSLHPHSDNLSLIVISGKDMMDLVHSLYERAMNEA